MAGKGKTVERGYGAEHRALRAWWKPQVATGDVPCHAVRCLKKEGRLIKPGDIWHLGHLPDRSGWTGPEHEECNVTEGSHRGNPPSPPKALRLRSWRPTRDW